MTVLVADYRPQHRPAIRQILERIGWAEQYVAAAERNAQAYSQNSDEYGVYVATAGEAVVGFVFVQFHEWNQLAQIQGLAVDPACQRQGIAAALVRHAERFARAKGARGVFVDTPTVNHKRRAFYEAIGYRFGYEMPRYYEDSLDGVTYQRFFVDS